MVDEKFNKYRSRFRIIKTRLARKFHQTRTKETFSPKELLVDYGLWSTTHGIPHILRVKFISSKIFWSFVLLAALLMCGIQLLSLYTKFLQREKKTSIEITAYQSSSESRSQLLANDLLRTRTRTVTSKAMINSPSSFGTGTSSTKMVSLISRSRCGCDHLNNCIALTKEVANITFANNMTCLCDNWGHCNVCDSESSCKWNRKNGFDLLEPSSDVRTVRQRRDLINFINIPQQSIVEGLTLALKPCFCDSREQCEMKHFSNALLVHCLCSQYDECKMCTARKCEWQILARSHTTAEQQTKQQTEQTTTTSPTTFRTMGHTSSTEAPFLYDFQNDTNEMTARTKIQENVIFVVANLNSTVREMIGYKKEELIIQCAFEAKSCDIPRDFAFYLDATYGNCFTFNANADNVKFRTRRAGPLNGLQVVLYTNFSDSLRLASETTGARVVIHHQRDDPFPDSYGYTVASGTATSFGIRKLTTKRQSKPYGDCIKNKSEVTSFYYDGSYSVEGCMRSCVQRQILDRCGCADPSFNLPAEYTVCDNLAALKRYCISQTVANADDNCEVCKVPCEQTEYAATRSTLPWGNDGKCNCNSTNRMDDTESLLVEVFYEQLSEQIISESPAYPSINLLSDVAGQVGFWVGMSVISMVEILVFLVKLVWYMFACEEPGAGRVLDSERTRAASVKQVSYATENGPVREKAFTSRPRMSKTKERNYGFVVKRTESTIDLSHIMKNGLEVERTESTIHLSHATENGLERENACTSRQGMSKPNKDNRGVGVERTESTIDFSHATENGLERENACTSRQGMSNTNKGRRGFVVERMESSTASAKSVVSVKHW